MAMFNIEIKSISAYTMQQQLTRLGLQTTTSHQNSISARCHGFYMSLELY